MPAFFSFAKDVFKPIAANALTIRNLLTLFVSDTTTVGMGSKLATIDIAKNPRMNQGKILVILKFIAT